MSGRPLSSEQRAARLWVDAAVREHGFASLDAVRDRQQARRAELEREGALADGRLAWLSLLTDLVRTSWPEGRGVVVVTGWPELERRRSDWHWREAGNCENDEWLVVAWGFDDRLADALGEEAPSAADALLTALQAMASWHDVEHPDSLPTSADATIELISEMKTAEAARAARASHEARIASERVQACEWRTANPNEPVDGLTAEQSELVLAIVASHAHYKEANKDREPENRNVILDILADNGWTKPRVKRIAGMIEVPDRDKIGVMRKMYDTKAKGGRLEADKESKEVKALIKGAQWLKPVAEHVLSRSSPK